MKVRMRRVTRMKVTRMKVTRRRMTRRRETRRRATRRRGTRRRLKIMKVMRWRVTSIRYLPSLQIQFHCTFFLPNAIKIGFNTVNV